MLPSVVPISLCPEDLQDALHPFDVADGCFAVVPINHNWPLQGVKILPSHAHDIFRSTVGVRRARMCRYERVRGCALGVR